MKYYILKNGTQVKTLTALEKSSIDKAFNDFALKNGCTSHHYDANVLSFIWTNPEGDKYSLRSADAMFLHE
jgi:hypothetical protein